MSKTRSKRSAYKKNIAYALVKKHQWPYGRAKDWMKEHSVFVEEVYVNGITPQTAANRIAYRWQ